MIVEEDSRSFATVHRQLGEIDDSLQCVVHRSWGKEGGRNLSHTGFQVEQLIGVRHAPISSRFLLAGIFTAPSGARLQPAFDSEGFLRCPGLWTSGVELGPRERFGGVGCSAGRTALMNAPRSVQFEIAVDFDADQTILHVRGDVDLLTAPTLHAAMNALVDQSHVDIVLELAGLTFMDASGLRVIADISSS